MRIEPNISYGTILQTIVFLVSLGIAYGRFVQRMTVLETKLNILWGIFVTRLGANDLTTETRQFFEAKK